MGYRVYYEEMFTVVHQVDELCQKWIDSFTGIDEKYTKLKDTSHIKGTAADNIKAYLEEIHGTVIPLLAEAVQGYLLSIGNYSGGYLTNVDGGNGSHTGSYCYNTLIFDELNAGGEVAQRFDGFIDRTNWLHESVERQRMSINDLVSLSGSKGEAFAEALDGAKNIAIATDNKVSQYESSQKNGLENVDTLLGELKSIISNQLSNQRTPVSSYVSGSIANMCNIENLVSAADNVSLEIQDRMEGYGIGAGAFDQMQEYKDYEIRQEQTKWIKIGVGIVAGIGMVALTVCTGGAAAVLGCAAIGIGKGVFDTVADVYAEKGSGTSFLNNVTSSDFYKKWDSKDLLSLGTNMVKGGIEGTFFALSAGSAGSAIQQPISTALRKSGLKAGETALTKGVDMFQDVGEAVIDGKPGKDIISIIKADTLDLAKETLVKSASSFVGGFVGARQEIANPSNQSFMDKVFNSATKTAAETTAGYAVGTAWDVGEAVLDGDSSTTVQSALDSNTQDYLKNLASKEAGVLFDEAASSIGGSITDGLPEDAKVVKGAIKGTVNSAADFAEKTFENVAEQVKDGSYVDIADAASDAWDDGKFVETIGDDITNGVKKEVDDYDRKLNRKADHKMVNVVTFEDGVDGVLLEDYEAALAVEGKGAYKNMDAQTILGLSHDVDVSLENVDIHHVNVADVQETKFVHEGGSASKVHTRATTATVRYEEVIQRIKDRNLR